MSSPVNALSALLADTYVLMLKTQNYHWNVKGPRFVALHELFEQQYRELFEAVDEIAERIRAIGELAPGTYAEFTELTSIEEKKGSQSADEMVEDLKRAHETVAATATKLRKAAEDDDVTQDLANERQQVHEKAAWMLRSLLD